MQFLFFWLFSEMDRQGLMFTVVEAEFRLAQDRVIITQSSTVGPGIGISLDRIYDQNKRTINFQGVA